MAKADEAEGVPCAHYNPKQGSWCESCWEGPETGVFIEDMPGNNERSVCPRVTFQNPKKEG